MAADLHIHVGKPHSGWGKKRLTKEGLPTILNPSDKDEAKYEAALKRSQRQPDVWVGEVSYLKAALSGNYSDFVPGPIQCIVELIPDARDLKPTKITAKLIKDVKKAFDLPNETLPNYELADPEEVAAFLRKHRGKWAYTVPW